MQEYTSRQQQIRRSAQQIYAVVSRFDNLTPAVADRVEEWQADRGDLFVQGQRLHRAVCASPKRRRTEPRHDQDRGRRRGRPDGFRLLAAAPQEVAPTTDTRMRLVLHIELNMMMRMMIGGEAPGRDRPDRRGARQVVQRRPAGLSGRRPQGERGRPEGRHRRCEGPHGRTSLAFRKKSRPPYRHRRNGVRRTT